MREKVTLEQFLSIKRQIKNIFEQALVYDEQNRNNPNYNESEVIKKFMFQYKPLLNYLLSRDLSDIPFDDWNEFYILGENENDVIDFSNTHANIDFSIFDILSSGAKGIYKNCNVRNIDKLGSEIQEELFDEITIKNNPQIFLSNIFSKEFKDKYYSRRLSIDDAVNLSQEQILELKQKENINNHFSGYCGYYMQQIGFEKLIQLYKQYPSDYNYLLRLHEVSKFYFDNELVLKLKDVDISEVKNICIDFTRKRYEEYGKIEIDSIPEWFIKDNDDIFLTNINMPQDLRERYYNRQLTTKDILYNFEIFKNLPIYQFMVFSSDLKVIAESFGKGNIQKILSDHFDVINYLYNEGELKNFSRYLVSNVGFEENFRSALKQYFIENLGDKFNYGNFDVPKWISSMNFNFIKEPRGVEDLGIDTIILNTTTNRILNTLGIDNIKKFDESTEFLKSYNFQYFLDLIERYLGTTTKKLENYEEFCDLIKTFLGESRINYDFIKGEFREKYKDIFVDENAPDEVKEKFYSRSLELNDFFNNPDLLKYFGNTNISYGLNNDFSWSIDLLNGGSNLSKKIKILLVYDKINNSDLKSVFKNFILEYNGDVQDDKIDKVRDLLFKISISNSSEVSSFGSQIAMQLLNLDDPFASLDKIEEVFLKNNLPMIGKTYSVFQLLHPNCNGFNFDESSTISPILKQSSGANRNVIIFSDLLKCAIGSNNRSIIEYLENIEKGNIIFEKVVSGQIEIDKLGNVNKDVLNIFVSHLNTLYNNTKAGKEKPRNLTGDIYKDISDLLPLFGTTEKYDLPDRIVRMFGYYAGFKSFEQLKQYLEQTIKLADQKNREKENKPFILEKGDLIKGIGNVKYLSNILQNGSVAREFLGDSASSDLTPLDTDLSMIDDVKNSIIDTLDSIEAGSYGPIFIVLKNDKNRFTITRGKDGQNDNNKPDLTKQELFYTGAAGDNHYGIRTGFPSSSIDYFLTKNYDDKIGLEIAKNGFYIPVVDSSTGKIVFSQEDYDKLREKMMGLSYYNNSDYLFSEQLESSEIKELADQVILNEEEVNNKRMAINYIVSRVLKKLNLEVKTSIDGDLTPGSVELIDTGSTGRGTNVPGDGDFDFMMRLDKEIISNPEQLQSLKKSLLAAFGKGDDSNEITGNGDFRLKGVMIAGLDSPVDIDITFVQKTNKINYSTDMSIRDRLTSIKSQDEDKYNLVVANILMAKRVLKDAGAYKPYRSDQTQGGMGGVGIENWILQNGGSFETAAFEFLKASKDKSFEEFKSTYSVWDFGENHLASQRGTYPHDNFITNNMSEIGYMKMQKVLIEYLENIKQYNNDNHKQI